MRAYLRKIPQTKPRNTLQNAQYISALSMDALQNEQSTLHCIAALP